MREDEWGLLILLYVSLYFTGMENSDSLSCPSSKEEPSHRQICKLSFFAKMFVYRIVSM